MPPSRPPNCRKASRERRELAPSKTASPRSLASDLDVPQPGPLAVRPQHQSHQVHERRVGRPQTWYGPLLRDRPEFLDRTCPRHESSSEPSHRLSLVDAQRHRIVGGHFSVRTLTDGRSRSALHRRIVDSRPEALASPELRVQSAVLCRSRIDGTWPSGTGMRSCAPAQFGSDERGCWRRSEPCWQRPP